MQSKEFEKLFNEFDQIMDLTISEKFASIKNHITISTIQRHLKISFPSAESIINMMLTHKDIKPEGNYYIVDDEAEYMKLAKHIESDNLKITAAIPHDETKRLIKRYLLHNQDFIQDIDTALHCDFKNRSDDARSEYLDSVIGNEARTYILNVLLLKHCHYTIESIKCQVSMAALYIAGIG